MNHLEDLKKMMTGERPAAPIAQLLGFTKILSTCSLQIR
ncbi:hypothetical protein BAOM_2422 [Peribacillus asahii]|uniref:Uncharacterized protein n=1 Tax=Peribacillus asahii TaxID=228899 RepID=A0A3Q9RN56_9BACI|nr:hypothetical protein BAOM_2422 [Peribacillus asahii]